MNKTFFYQRTLALFISLGLGLPNPALLGSQALAAEHGAASFSRSHHLRMLERAENASGLEELKDSLRAGQEGGPRVSRGLALIPRNRQMIANNIIITGIPGGANSGQGGISSFVRGANLFRFPWFDSAVWLDAVHRAYHLRAADVMEDRFERPPSLNLLGAELVLQFDEALNRPEVKEVVTGRLQQAKDENDSSLATRILALAMAGEDAEVIETLAPTKTLAGQEEGVTLDRTQRLDDLEALLAQLAKAFPDVDAFKPGGDWLGLLSGVLVQPESRTVELTQANVLDSEAPIFAADETGGHESIETLLTQGAGLEEEPNLVEGNIQPGQISRDLWVRLTSADNLSEAADEWRMVTGGLGGIILEEIAELGGQTAEMPYLPYEFYRDRNPRTIPVATAGALLRAQVPTGNVQYLLAFDPAGPVLLTNAFTEQADQEAWLALADPDKRVVRSDEDLRKRAGLPPAGLEEVVPGQSETSSWKAAQRWVNDTLNTPKVIPFSKYLATVSQRDWNQLDAEAAIRALKYALIDNHDGPEMQGAPGLAWVKKTGLEEGQGSADERAAQARRIAQGLNDLGITAYPLSPGPGLHISRDSRIGVVSLETAEQIHSKLQEASGEDSNPSGLTPVGASNLDVAREEALVRHTSQPGTPLSRIWTRHRAPLLEVADSLRALANEQGGVQALASAANAQISAEATQRASLAEDLPQAVLRAVAQDLLAHVADELAFNRTVKSWRWSQVTRPWLRRSLRAVAAATAEEMEELILTRTLAGDQVGIGARSDGPWRWHPVARHNEGAYWNTFHPEQFAGIIHLFADRMENRIRRAGLDPSYAENVPAGQEEASVANLIQEAFADGTQLSLPLQVATENLPNILQGISGANSGPYHLLLRAWFDLDQKTDSLVGASISRTDGQVLTPAERAVMAQYEFSISGFPGLPESPEWATLSGSEAKTFVHPVTPDSARTPPFRIPPNASMETDLTVVLPQEIAAEVATSLDGQGTDYAVTIHVRPKVPAVTLPAGLEEIQRFDGLTNAATGEIAPDALLAHLKPGARTILIPAQAFPGAGQEEPSAFWLQPGLTLQAALVAGIAVKTLSDRIAQAEQALKEEASPNQVAFLNLLSGMPEGREAWDSLLGAFNIVYLKIQPGAEQGITPQNIPTLIAVARAQGGSLEITLITSVEIEGKRHILIFV